MRIVRRTYRVIERNIKEIVLFEVLYRFMTVLIAFFLATRGIQLAVKFSGYRYVTSKNLTAFFLKPVSLLVLLIFGILVVFGTLLEITSLLTAYRASERDEKLNCGQIFLGGFQMMKGMLRRGKWGAVITAVLIAAISSFPFVYHILLMFKPIKDAMKVVNKTYWIQVLIGFIVVLLTLYLLPHIFSVHFTALDQKQWKEAKRYSRRFVKKKWMWVLFQYVILMGGCWLVCRGILYVFTFIMAWLIHTFVDRSIQLALFLTGFDWLERIMLILEGICTMGLELAVLTGMYYQYRDDADMEPELLISFEEEKRREDIGQTTFRWIICVLIGVVACIGIDLIANGIYYAKEVLTTTQITAHRGSSYAAPENTLASLQLAMDEMADYAEIDLQQTSDGVIVLAHDKTFKRTAGVNRAVYDMTYEEVKKLDVGSYQGVEYAGERVPTFEEVLELCNGKIMLNIELKSNKYNPEFVKDVLELLEEYNFTRKCVITSTSLALLKEVEEQKPEIQTGYILSTVYGSFCSNDVVDFFSISSSALNEANISYIHENGREVHAWTVNSKAEIERMKRLEVDNIITDYPLRAREILYRPEDTESILEFVKIVLK